MDREDHGEGPGSELNLQDLETLGDLGLALHALRHRHARREVGKEFTYRELAARTGYSFQAIGEYFAGKVLASTERLDVLVTLMGASAGEQRIFATARDNIEERQRRSAATTLEPPQQLPAANPKFVGRESELAALAQTLQQVHGMGGTAISVIEGMPGVGKTALAICWAHRVADQFPDGQLYVDLRGFDHAGQQVQAAEVLHYFLVAFHIPASRIPARLDQRAAKYRTMLAGKRVLIVLDNAYDSETIRTLLPGSSTCAAVVTSRNTLPRLIADGATLVLLDLLTTDEARRLLFRYLGCERVAGEPEAVDELIDRCGRLPLALTIVAARAATRPTSPLKAFCNELRDRTLGAFATEDATTTLEAVFSWSYDHLADEAQRMFRLLGVHRGPDISVAAAASLAGMPRAEAHLLLTTLSHAHLVQEPVSERFAFHDLLRNYAAKLAHQTDNDTEIRLAVNRVLDHYLHTGHSAALLLNGTRPKLSLDPCSPGAVPEGFCDITEASAWFKAERSVLLAATTQAVDHGFDSHAWQIPWTLVDFLDRHGHWDDMTASHRPALLAAQRLDNLDGQARTHGALGRAYRRQGHYEEALVHFTILLDIFKQLGNTGGQARAHRSIAQIREDQGRNIVALHHAEQALRLTADPIGRAGALNQVGWYQAQLGNYELALDNCLDALNLYQKHSGDSHEQAAAWDSIGFIQHHLKGYTEAIHCYTQAITLFDTAGDQYKKAETLLRLGETHQAAGRSEIAHDIWQQAWVILSNLGHPKADEAYAKIHGPRIKEE
jgi:hypothetical protein